MKPILPTAFALLAFGSLVAQAQDAAPPAGYKLVWADDFQHDPDGLPDPTKWGYEKGFVRNHEAQYYTEKRLENIRVEHGQLIIEARKEEFPNPDPTDTKHPRLAHYTSGSITTEGHADWQYGRIDIRAKMPAGQGVWPALWTLGTNIRTEKWPRCGEIDLVEMFGNSNRIRGNFHYALDGKHVASNGGSRVVPDANTNFHLYTIDWDKDRIQLSVDGVKYAELPVEKATAAGENPYRKPHYLILNLALGGSGGGKIDDSIFPQRMVVEFVHVYQKEP